LVEGVLGCDVVSDVGCCAEHCERPIFTEVGRCPHCCGCEPSIGCCGTRLRPPQRRERFSLGISRRCGEEDVVVAEGAGIDLQHRRIIGCRGEAELTGSDAAGEDLDERLDRPGTEAA